MAYDPLDFLKASTTKRFMNFVYGGDIINIIRILPWCVRSLCDKLDSADGGLAVRISALV